MGYEYAEHKSQLFTEQGQRDFLQTRDRVYELLKKSGACRMAEIMSKAGGSDTWFMLACVDRLVELGELLELQYPSGTPMGQFRVFVSKRDGW